MWGSAGHVELTGGSARAVGCSTVAPWGEEPMVGEDVLTSLRRPWPSDASE